MRVLRCVSEVCVCVRAGVCEYMCTRGGVSRCMGVCVCMCAWGGYVQVKV